MCFPLFRMLSKFNDLITLFIGYFFFKHILKGYFIVHRFVMTELLDLFYLDFAMSHQSKLNSRR